MSLEIFVWFLVRFLRQNTLRTDLMLIGRIKLIFIKFQNMDYLQKFFWWICTILLLFLRFDIPFWHLKTARFKSIKFLHFWNFSAVDNVIISYQIIVNIVSTSVHMSKKHGKWLNTGQIKAWMTILTWYSIEKFIALSKKIVDYVSWKQKLIRSMRTMSYFLTFAQIWHLLVLVIKMCIEVVGNKSYW